MKAASEIRLDLLRALELDLVGPGEGLGDPAELLPQPPSRWYLTGFLVPYEAEEKDRRDETANDQLDLGGGPEGNDDDEEPEPASARKALFPSSIGLSVLVPREATTLDVDVRWGDYARIAPEQGKEDATEGSGNGESRVRWQRQARNASFRVPVAASVRPTHHEVPDSGGLRITVSVRSVPTVKGAALGELALPPGCRAVSVFLVNHRPPQADELRDQALAFQVQLMLRCDEGFCPRPDPRGLLAESWDDRVADLQYRDAFEHTVGHGVAGTARIEDGGSCREVATTWIPRAEVEKIDPAPVAGVELSMEALAACSSAVEVREKIGLLVTEYEKWIAEQRTKAPSAGRRAEVARELLDQAKATAARIARGLAALDEADVLEAFCLANRVMATAARRRRAQLDGTDAAEGSPPTWRPFQLAFLLLNLGGIANPGDREREIVDLLFFPTGGGKTEAYLGLAAFTLVLRRLRRPGVSSAGVTVLMRYTLRLLTLDQLSRAATLICALELERQKQPERLGPWPFEIGLWVGRGATPNAMGRRGDASKETARARTIAFQNDDRKPAPIPLENCPWCGTKFTRHSFQLVPTPHEPTDLRVACVNRRCEFRGDRALPLVTVDEPIYRRLPCFLVATVDKFAGLPWVGRAGALFGKVERHDRDGFYGPCDPGRGRRLDGELLPPELIVQDELHLISGPLGTMVGLYETAIEALSTREDGERKIRPKIVASTATVRRAESQIRALFNRTKVDVFPPPGPDRRDTFFARTVSVEEKPARLYAGVAAQGRSPKVILLRTYLALLAAAQRAWEEAGGTRSALNAADPYMTLVGYFNSLRELGGSRRIVEDEVNARLAAYGGKMRLGEREGSFTNRKIRDEVIELTSREPTSKVADAKRRLALAFSHDERVDVALATNMISVGLDITRLGLMVVLGQPKTTAEYIQASSRVGRDDARPGLVVTLFNVHRPRDRSHYERFAAYHASFYRGVEVTSVTPFAPRAVDRGLAAVTVALARQGRASLTPPKGAALVLRERPQLQYVTEAIARRAEGHAPLSHADAEGLRRRLQQRVADLLDDWTAIARQKEEVGAGLQYQREESGPPALLLDPLDPEMATKTVRERKFRAQRSLRDVEPSVGVWVRRMDGIELPEEDEP